MSVNAELALAASRVSTLAKLVPEGLRPDLAREWRELMDELNDRRSDKAKLAAIGEWRSRVEGRLTQRLAHAPLQPTTGGSRAISAHPDDEPVTVRGPR